MGVVEEDRGSKQRLTDEQLEEEEGGERNREENRGITLGVPRCSGQGGKRVWGRAGCGHHDQKIYLILVPEPGETQTIDSDTAWN